MRNPNRLDPFYTKLCELHKNIFPDWRLSQLFLNYFAWHYENYGTDGFYVEDDDFIDRFTEFIISTKGE